MEIGKIGKRKSPSKGHCHDQWGTDSARFSEKHEKQFLELSIWMMGSAGSYLWLPIPHRLGVARRGNNSPKPLYSTGTWACGCPMALEKSLQHREARSTVYQRWDAVSMIVRSLITVHCSCSVYHTNYHLY